MIGIDHRIALAAIANQYNDLVSEGRSREDIARDYLGKIIQLPIRLDRPSSTDLERFVREHLFRGVDPPPEAESASNAELELGVPGKGDGGLLVAAGAQRPGR